MIKLGLVSEVTNYHTLAFSRLINGADDSKPENDRTTTMKGIPIPDARIVSIYDPNPDEAKKLSKARFIDHVARSLEKMYKQGLDGVIVITNDATMDHGEQSIGFLEQGIPTYIDKPLAPTLEKAERLITLSREKGALMMSCSALRYARELEEFQKGREEVGEIVVGVGVAAVGEVLRYGIHPLELVHTVIGRGVEYVQNVGDEGSNVVKIAYPDGRRIVLLAFKNISYTLEGVFYGKKGRRAVIVKDDGYFYSNMLKHFVEGIKNKRMPIPLEDTLEIVKICLAAERSLKTGERVYLN